MDFFRHIPMVCIDCKGTNKANPMSRSHTCVYCGAIIKVDRRRAFNAMPGTTWLKRRASDRTRPV